MTRRDALIRVIEALHAEINALKSNDIAGLERATQTKLACIDAVASAPDNGPLSSEARQLAEEAQRLNETCRIYVNLMAANVRRRLNQIAGLDGAGYRPSITAVA
ncbi:MAG: flagellar protein FlgN [Sphingomonas sp.]|nr:flagellar protein FlgN [Sphingomonas sp.]